MKILSSVASNVTKAADFVVEANRKSALINRTKAVVRCEEKNIDRAHVALGKYHFDNLRSKNLEKTERHCLALESFRRRLDRALARLGESTDKREGEYDEYEDYEDCCACQTRNVEFDSYDGDMYENERNLHRVDGAGGTHFHGASEYDGEFSTSGAKTSGEAADETDGSMIPPTEEWGSAGMKPSIICFSQAGKTKKLRGCVTKPLDTDFVELRETVHRDLVSAYALGMYDATRRKSGDILPVDSNIAEYEMLIMTSPVWAGNITPTTNDFIQEYDLRGKTVYGFVTHAGGADEALNLMCQELERAEAVCPHVPNLQAARELIYDVKAGRKTFRLINDGKLELRKQGGDKKA